MKDRLTTSVSNMTNSSLKKSSKFTILFSLNDFHNKFDSEDDEDEDEEAEVTEKADDQGEASVSPSEEPVSDDQKEGAIVKPEPKDDAIPPPKKRSRTPSHELHIYTSEELSQFRKKDLMADVVLHEGTFLDFHIVY